MRDVRLCSSCAIVALTPVVFCLSLNAELTLLYLVCAASSTVVPLVLRLRGWTIDDNVTADESAASRQFTLGELLLGTTVIAGFAAILAQLRNLHANDIHFATLCLIAAMLSIVHVWTALFATLRPRRALRWFFVCLAVELGLLVTSESSEALRAQDAANLFLFSALHLMTLCCACWLTRAFEIRLRRRGDAD
ncbi:MAG: hypothetical protein QM811_18735 [Pirellulales bacterium]